MKYTRCLSRACPSLALALTITFGRLACAQSDNFDSGTLDPAWKESNFSPSLRTLSFPTTPTGKGLRIQANPFPGAAPAVEGLYREDVYTDFYMAVDVIEWGGYAKDQAIVLIARSTLAANPAEATGIICNYDTAQDGDGAGDREGGQFQINMVGTGFSTLTLAASEVTLVPGRSYRITFKGIGSRYTAALYDLSDLTRPFVTIVADDVEQGAGREPYTSGKCGLLSFYRNGTGSTDITLDNYYAAATDPNGPEVGAIAHPVDGTPTVVVRSPEKRFQNFLNPANPISFTAKTFGAGTINASATKLFLNGTDVSSQLSLVTSDAGATLTGTLPGGVLQANKLYTAEITVEDPTGTKKSNNLFWFDTFSEAFLKSASAKVIEAENFNYDLGQRQADPIPVSGYDTTGNPVNGAGVGYLEIDSTTTDGVDFHDLRTTPEGRWFSEYRPGTPVGFSAGMFSPEQIDFNDLTGEIRYSDQIRSDYVANNLLEMVVHRTQVGEWLNYTRDFAPASYTPFLRVAAFGPTKVELHRVTSDPALPDQTTVKLGTFNVPNTTTRYFYQYVPLVDDAGAPVKIDLSGTQTLRLVTAGTPTKDDRKIAINYLLLASLVEELKVSVDSQTASSMLLTWTGGTGKFLVQKRIGFGSGQPWIDVLTTTERSARVTKDGAAGFFRVQSDYTGPEVLPLTAFLSGDAETPKITTTATGVGTLSLKDNTLSFIVTYNGLQGDPSAAHIHGSATMDSTVGAGVMVGIPAPSGRSGVISGSVTLTADQKANVLAGRSYVNIHTSVATGGEIRGNILRTRYATVMNGANEIPPVSTTGTGTGIVNVYGNELWYFADWSALSSPANGGHIHLPATATGSAPPVVIFSGVSGVSGSTSGVLTAAQNVLGALLDGKAYVNIHTETNGGGEIRGQLAP